MAEMNPKSPDLLDKNIFNAVRSELLQVLADIKMYIWTGELEAARTELALLLNRYGSLFWQANEVKKNMTSRYRNRLRFVERQVQAEGMTGLMCHWHTQNRMAEVIALQEPEEDRLYLLSPFVSDARRIDEYLAVQLKEKKLWSIKAMKASMPISAYELGTSKPDKIQAEFILSLNSFGPDHWEIRGYLQNRSGFPEDAFSPQPILDMLKKKFVGRQVTIEIGHTQQGEKTWPVWQRLFLDFAFIELKLYAPDRFIAFIVVHDETDLNALINNLLECIHQSGSVSDELETSP